MTTPDSAVTTLCWREGHLHLLDQRVLPGTVREVACGTCDAVAAAIRDMVVCGAPAIGCAAAYGAALSVAARTGSARWRDGVDADLARLEQARPTAVNLEWAVDQVVAAAMAADDPATAALETARRIEAAEIHRDCPVLDPADHRHG